MQYIKHMSCKQVLKNWNQCFSKLLMFCNTLPIFIEITSEHNFSINNAFCSFFLAIAEALNCKICVTSEKKGVLSCLEDQCIMERITLKWTEAKVHVLPMGKLRLDVRCSSSIFIWYLYNSCESLSTQVCLRYVFFL